MINLGERLSNNTPLGRLIATALPTQLCTRCGLALGFCWIWGLGVNGGGNMYRGGGANMYHGLGGSLSA